MFLTSEYMKLTSEYKSCVCTTARVPVDMPESSDSWTKQEVPFLHSMWIAGSSIYGKKSPE